MREERFENGERSTARIGLRDSREIHPGCKNVIYPHRYKYTMVLLIIINL